MRRRRPFPIGCYSSRPAYTVIGSRLGSGHNRIVFLQVRKRASICNVIYAAFFTFYVNIAKNFWLIRAVLRQQNGIACYWVLSSPIKVSIPLIIIIVSDNSRWISVRFYPNHRITSLGAYKSVIYLICSLITYYSQTKQRDIAVIIFSVDIDISKSACGIEPWTYSDVVKSRLRNVDIQGSKALIVGMCIPCVSLRIVCTEQLKNMVIVVNSVCRYKYLLSSLERNCLEKRVLYFAISNVFKIIQRRVVGNTSCFCKQRYSQCVSATEIQRRFCITECILMR